MKIDESAFLAALTAEEAAAYGRENDELSSDRAKAIDYYFGRPYGNEIPDRSQVVTREVMDTIEWIKPSLLRVFTGGGDICQFEPRGPEDEETAKQESDYVNYVLQSQNPWFQLCYTWFTDALLTKNAYCLAYWEKSNDVQRESYSDLSDDQIALLLQDPEVEIVAHASTEVPAGGYAETPQYPVAGHPIDLSPLMPMGMAPDGMGMAPMAPTMPIPAAPTVERLHSVTLQRKRERGQVKLEVLPPERCLVSFRTKSFSVRDADFFEYWDDKTISELRGCGFKVDDDISDAWTTENSIEDQARNQYREHVFSSDVRNDPAMRQVRVRTAWLRFDADGDGIAELRQCVVVGNTILDNREVNGIPVAAIVPTPVPHRHPGLSIADMTMDLQKIKSTLLRQGLDNGYLQNNGRYAVSDKVNLDDLLVSRPGGIVRVDGYPGQEIMPLTHPGNGGAWLQMLEYVDQIKENRTGTGRYFTGVDQNALNKTASGIAQLTSSAAQRVEAIARIFAEGVKELCLIVHELALKNSARQETMRLRGKWTPVDPRQWAERRDLTISVGLGTGSKETQIGALLAIFAAQKEALALGIATPQNMHNTLSELTKAYGFQSPEKFWTEVPPGQQADPGADQAQGELQAAMQAKQQEMQVDMQVKQAEIQADMQVKQAELDFQRWKAELDANTKITIAQISSTPEPEVVSTEQKPTHGDEATNTAIDAALEKIGNLVAQQETRMQTAAASEASQAMHHDFIETVGKLVNLLNARKKISFTLPDGRKASADVVPDQLSGPPDTSGNFDGIA